MEKIFDRYKTEVDDRGFSENVIGRILPMRPPSKAMYRTPTLIATIAATAAIVILTLTVGLGTMNEKYEKCVNAIAWRSE